MPTDAERAAALAQLEDKPGVVVELNFEATPQKDGSVQISRAKPGAKVEPVVEPVVTPVLLAGKFKDAAALEAAYKELEKKLGAPKEPAVEPKVAKPTETKMGKENAPAKSAEELAAEAAIEAAKTPEQKAADALAAEELAATEAAAALAAEEAAKAPDKVDFTALSEEFADTGELSEASYDKLAKSGIDKAMTDQYIAGIQAIQTVRVQSLHEAAGGKDAFTNLVAWGTANLDAASQASFNKAIDVAVLEDDPTAAVLLIQGIKSAMGSNEPNQVSGKGKTQSAAAEPFANRAEQTAAMGSRTQYGKDPDYTRAVEARIAASTYS